MDIGEFSIKYCGTVIQPHQKKWIKFVEKTKHRGLLLAPRGHGKTTTINYIWLSWVIANNPELRILLISHSKDMAEKFSMAVRNVMENKELQEEFDFKEDTPWRANSWRLNKSPQSKPTLECKGALGRMTGWRGDMIIFDDLLEFSTDSEKNRIKLENWRTQSVIPALDTHKLDKIIVVGTRKRIDDWYGELLTGTLYDNRVDRAFRNKEYMTDENAQPLAPHFYDEDGNIVGDWWTREALLRRREEIGALKFEQEYMNNPSPPEGLQLKYDWLRFYEHLPDHGHLEYFAGIDPSAGKSKDTRTSFLALCIVAYDRIYNKIYVTDFYRGKHSPQEQVSICRRFLDKYGEIKKIYVEAVFEYTYVYNALRDLYLNVISKDYIHTKLKGVSDVSKEGRVMEVLAPNIEIGKIIFKHPSQDPYTKIFINHEYIAFPYGDFDMLDSLTLAVHRLVGLRYRDEQPFYFPET